MTDRAYRICYISPTGRIGGGEVSLLHLLCGLSGDWRPVVVCYGKGDLVDALRAKGIEVEVILRGGRFSEFILLCRLIRLFRDKRIDLVHVNTLDIRAGVAARLAGRRLLGHLRVVFPTTWIDKLFVSLSHRTIAVSRATVRAFTPGNTGPRRKFVVIPNGVYLPSATPAANLRSELKLPPQTRLIGAVGRLDPVKGFEYLIEAAPRILSASPDVRFLIVGRAGDSAEEQQYERQLRAHVRRLELEERVLFLGYRADALSVISALDILVVPSVTLGSPGSTRTEGFGRVAAEAMGTGVPVIASAAGGLREVLDEGTAGLLIPEASPEAIAQSVGRLLGDCALKQQLIRAARQRFQNVFAIHHHVRAVEALYGRLLRPAHDRH